MIVKRAREVQPGDVVETERWDGLEVSEAVAFRHPLGGHQVILTFGPVAPIPYLTLDPSEPVAIRS